MKKHLIGGSATIVEALEALNRLSGDTMTLFAVDEDGRLLGSLTDGDIRRALLKGHSLGDPVADVCHRDCLRAPQIAEARAAGVTLLPVVEDGRVVSLIDLKKRRGFIPADALLMAGGVGERLRPLTETVPKPMLPVGGIPIIDHNIRLLRAFGVENIFVAVNYLKEQIKDHLKDEVEYVEEPCRMGTIGALGLLPGNIMDPLGERKDILVMNSDLLTDADLEAMYLKHAETDAWLTVGAVPYSVAVPFAILDHEGDRVTGLTEKPTYNYYANAGIYILKKEAANFLKTGTPTDATDLMERLIRAGKRVSLFPLDGRWMDIGSPDDYRRACETGL